MVYSAAISEIIVKGKLRQILITMTETTAHFVSLKKKSRSTMRSCAQSCFSG